MILWQCTAVIMLMGENILNQFEAKKLSVIVPCYKVEEYIKDCLDSLAQQTFFNMEVIMVDDGSPDNTGVILDQYADRYDNFIAVHTENGGLSAARNAGLPYVTGEFMAFVDSDDIVEENAYEVLVGSLINTGSDMASGFVNRLKGSKMYPSILHETAIPETILHTHINENPFLVYDTTAWNKVYRSSVFFENNIKYPVSLTYEDIPVSMKFHLLAKAVDVIDMPIYKWRVRESSNQSITQQRGSFKLFWDRIQTLEMARHSIEQLGGNDKVKEAFNFKVLDMDIPLYLNSFQNANDETLFAFQQDLVKFLRNYNLDDLKRISIRKQIQYRSILSGNFIDFKRYGYQRLDIGKTVLKNDNYEYVNNALNKDIVKKISVRDSFEIKGKTTKISEENGQVLILGFMDFVRTTKFNPESYKINVFLRNKENQKTFNISMEWNLKKKHRFSRRRKSKYEISFSMAEAIDNIGLGKWEIDYEVEANNIRVTGLIGHPTKRSNQLLDPLEINGNYVVNTFNKAWDLQFVVGNKQNSEMVHNHVDRIEHTSTGVTVFATVQSKSTSLAIRTSENKFAGITEITDSSESSYHIKSVWPYAEVLSEGSVKGSLGFYDIDSGASFPYSFAHQISPMDFEHGQFEGLIKCDNLKKINLNIIKKEVQVVSVNLDNGVLTLKLHDDLKILFQSISDKELTFGISSLDGKSSYNHVGEIDFDKNSGDITVQWKLYNNGTPVISNNRYECYLDVKGSNESRIALQSIMSRDTDLSDFENKNFKTKVLFDQQGKLIITSWQRWSFWNRSARKRSINYSLLYPLMRLLPLNNKVAVFESYWGTAYNDNPRSIYEYWSDTHPDFKFVWPMQDMTTELPEKTIKVRRYSLKYWYYLAVGKYFIQNTNFPNQYVKRSGQIEVETLHGTFMKKMGFEEPSMRNSSANAQKNFLKRNSRWNFLISPSEYMDETAKKAFDFKNKILSVGFPRNDVLINDNNAAYIEAKKNSMGIPNDKKIILYAPTYRQAGILDFELDLSKLRDKFGDDYIVLVRVHHLVASAIDLHKFSGFAIDMSAYQSIEDLYLISDLMITDYSSVMFDYGYLKKPMIFFAYDLDWYEDSTNRGVYLDYKNTVPGPVVTTNEELIEQLANIDDIKSRYANKLNDFYDRFCSYGRDGKASEKTVESLLKADAISQDNFIRNKFWTTKLNKFLGVSDLRIAFQNFLGGKVSPKKIIIFESNDGNSYSGDPRALYKKLIELDSEYVTYWNVNRDTADFFRRNNIPYVIKDSYWGSLKKARAMYWITDSDLPIIWKKPRHTKVVQTGQGSPLKTVGTDLSSDFIPGQTIYQYQRDQVRMSRKWDYMIAGNDESADIFENAYRLSNHQLIRSGLPRNDVFYNNNVDYIRSIKNNLDISHFSKVILYAPTWMDNDILYTDKYLASDIMDFSEVDKHLSNDTVMLVHFHPRVAANRPDLSGFKHIMDVTDYQQINDICLVSDLLISDYSSVVNDFANLRRPMIFLAKNPEKFDSYIHGLYLDYQSEMPGPIVKNTAELINELDIWKDSSNSTWTYKEQLEEYWNKYCGWEHGDSADRVWNFIFKNLKYKVREQKLTEDTSGKVNDGAALWSNVYGSGTETLIANLDLVGGLYTKCLKVASLVDPIQNENVGMKFYQIKYNDTLVWVSEKEIELG